MAKTNKAPKQPKPTTGSGPASISVSGKTSSGTGSTDTIVLPRSLVVGIQSIDISSNRGVDVPLTDSATFYYNQDITKIRNLTSPFDVMRALVKLSGDTSMAVASYVRLANTKLNFKVYDSNHQLNDQGMVMLQSFLTTLAHLNDYTYGFDDRQPLTQITESLFWELMLTGASAAELVLDKTRLPFRIQVVSPSKVKWRISELDIGNGVTHKLIPWQQYQGVTIELDIPTFFVTRLDQDVTLLYPKPPMESALNAVVFSAETMNDIRRVVKKSGHSRLVVTLKAKEIAESAPANIRTDPEALAAWLLSVRTALETQISTLNPESALVTYDNVEASYLNSEIGASADYGPLMDMVDGQSATALRTPPSVLGKRMGGSQNISSSESLLFLQHVAGIQKPVEALMNRILTLGMRLLGFPGYVETKFDPVSLRPEIELEAFKTMRQQRVLEQLSLGLITDQEACIELGLGIRPPTAPILSGTMFMIGATQTTMDPNSIANGGDPAKRALTGDTPTKAGGKSQ